MTAIRNSYKQRACAPRTSSDKQCACAPRTPLFKHLSRACACLTSSYTCAFRRQALWDSLPVAVVSGMVHPMSEIGMYDETHTLHSAPLHTFSQISIIKRQRTAFAQPRELQAIYVTPAMGIPEKKSDSLGRSPPTFQDVNVPVAWCSICQKTSKLHAVLGYINGMQLTCRE